MASRGADLVQILLQLKGAGLVYSSRGAAGGYRLARPADQISLGEVLSAIDGPGEPFREAQEPAAQALASVWEHLPRTSAPSSIRRPSPSSPAARPPRTG